ncbi:MAG: hemerythrin family protein [Rhodocyclaceae bacterium]|nr:hemerythrin family protein [Rhodocyclaceae bacterium]
MDPKYNLGIPEIDAQHQEIGELVKALQEAIADSRQRYLVHPTLKRLHQLLVTHFDYEESFLKMLNADELRHHKAMHKGILKLFEDYFDHPPAPADYEYFGKVVGDKVLGHVMNHDDGMAASMRAYFGNFKASAQKVPGKP